MQKPRSVGVIFFLAAWGAAALSGCGPTWNWRDVRLDDAGLTALLPCKPDRAVRQVQLGSAAPQDLTMVGCDAGGATFAVSHLLIDEPAQASATLALWQSAVRARMQASATADTDATVNADAAKVFAPTGALRLPQSVRVRLAAQSRDGSSPVADAVWFARLEGAQARLYHAVVVSAASKPAPAQAVQTFLDGLRLQ